MGEAKRRKELKLPVTENKIQVDKSNRFFANFSNGYLLFRKFPYIGVVTMIIGVTLFLASGGANIIYQ